MNNYTNSKRSLAYLTAAALAGTIAGCRFNGDPASDLRFLNSDPKNTLVTSTDEDQEYTAKFLRSLNNRIFPLDQVALKGNDGLVFVTYDSRPKGVTRNAERPYDLETTARILEEGIIKGEEVSGNGFRAYASLDECMAAVRKEQEVFAGNPVVSSSNVEGKAETKIETKNQHLKTNVNYDKSSAVLVVDFNRNRVVGLYEVDELEKIWSDPSIRLNDGDVKNLLKLETYAHHKVLVEGVRKVLRPTLSEEDTDELLRRVGRTTSYLLESEFDLSFVNKAVRDYNAKFTAHNSLVARGLNDVGTIAKIRDVREKKSDRTKDYRTVYPKQFKLEHCIELFVDKDGIPSLRVLEKPKE